MSTPRSILIGGRRWRVLREPTLTDDCRGETDFDTRTIRVDPSITGTEYEEVLLHELLHACVPEADLFAKGTDELFVTLAAPRLLAVLRRLGLRL